MGEQITFPFFFSRWGINRRGKSSVRNLRYGPQTPLVRGIDNNNSNSNNNNNNNNNNNDNDNDNDDDDDNNNAVSLLPELAPEMTHKPTTLNNYTKKIARRKYAR